MSKDYFVKPCPCNTCQNKNLISGNCTTRVRDCMRFREWFSGEWAAFRKMYKNGIRQEEPTWVKDDGREV